MTWLAIILIIFAAIVFLLGLFQVLTGKVVFGKDFKSIYTASSLRHYAHATGRDILIGSLGLAQMGIDMLNSGKFVFASLSYSMVLLCVLLFLYSRRVLIKK